MKDIHIIEVLGFKVFSDDLAKISTHSIETRIINTISPNSYGISTKDTEFNKTLKQSDYLVLDGVYFAIGSILLKGKNIKRNQGPDVFYHFMERMNEAGGRVFFFGSANNTLLKIRDKAAKEYPNIKIGYLSPPFKEQFAEDENIRMCEEINAFKPDIVFVGMTCPKQEKWSVQNKHRINSGLIISIGNVFDWFAGTQKPIHPIWFKLRIGWLVRIFLRPEIFKRNISNQMKFFADVLLMFFRLKPQIND